MSELQSSTPLKQRLDQAMADRHLVASRSQAESYIKLGKVTVDGQPASKPGQLVKSTAAIKVLAEEQFVSRAALKLASVAHVFNLDFADKTVLDIGSSTGGFTQYALSRGARLVVAVEVGTNQLHPSLHGDGRIELHEQTDIRNFRTAHRIDIVVADVSFISLAELLPTIRKFCQSSTILALMVKPQFEASQSSYKHKGVIKNDRIRRDILKDFETAARQQYVIIDKADSDVAGAKGNLERFYLLKPLA